MLINCFCDNCTLYCSQDVCFWYNWSLIDWFDIVVIYSVFLLWFALFLKNTWILSFKVGFQETHIADFYILCCLILTLWGSFDSDFIFKTTYKDKDIIFWYFGSFFHASVTENFLNSFHFIKCLATLIMWKTLNGEEKIKQASRSLESAHMVLDGQWETKYHRTLMVSQAWPWRMPARLQSLTLMHKWPCTPGRTLPSSDRTPEMSDESPVKICGRPGIEQNCILSR